MNNSLIQEDLLQRELALNPAQSFIVQAPAGSGKTELLIQRFLTLLCYIEQPEEIIALTFTKKAAHEMRMRLVKTLKQAVGEIEPEMPHAKKTWSLARRVLARAQEKNWNLLNNPNRLSIQTIDSLCVYLTQQLPLLSHFGGNLEITTHPQTLYEIAVQNTLGLLEENVSAASAIEKLFVHLDNDYQKLQHLLIYLLTKRDQWLPYLFHVESEQTLKLKLEHYLSLIIEEALYKLKKIFPPLHLQNLITIARFAATHLSADNATPLATCKELIAVPGTHADNLNIWLALASLLLTKEGQWRKQLNKSIGFPPLNSLKNSAEKAIHLNYRMQLQEIIAALSDSEDLRSTLQNLFLLPQPIYQAPQWEILQALFAVLKIVVAQLRLTFKQYGLIDFIENAQAASTALIHDEVPTDLALALDYQWKHILVDEFQDTSLTQYQFLEKIIAGWQMEDNRTLFIVGDPMQSIYRFRDAEVGIFIRMCKEGIGAIRLTPITLSVNFRSVPALIEWNNRHYQHIFPTYNEIASGAVSFSPSVSLHTPLLDVDSIIIQAANTDQAQNINIIENIQYLLKTYPKESIAILVRSRSHLGLLIPLLKKHHLAYQAIDIDYLSSKAAIQDLLALTYALLHLGDRIAWLSILRAPWCGLSLSDLLILSGDHPATILWERINNAEVLEKLSVDGQKRLLRIQTILQLAFSERGRQPLRFWIERTWLMLGGPATLVDEYAIQDVRAFFDLLTELGNQDEIASIDLIKMRMQSLFADASQTNARIHIMTIHSAKGLEFDTVILPHLERKMPYDDPALLLWMERPLKNDKTALLLAPMHPTGHVSDAIYKYIQSQIHLKINYETDRLLYVATTRAKKRLFLSWTITKKNENPIIQKGSFLEKLWPLIKNHYQEVNDTKIIETSKNSLLLTRLASHWQHPLHLKQTPTSTLHQSIGFQLNDEQPRLIGILIHRILQFLAKYGLSWWLQYDMERQSEFIYSQLKQLGIPAANLENAVQVALEIMQQVIKDKKSHWIFAKYKEAAAELPLSIYLENQVTNYVIDRTFVDQDNIRWIIDYKTTLLNQKDLNFFMVNEKLKYQNKMMQYKEAMCRIDTREIRTALYFPAMALFMELYDTSVD